MESYLTGMRAAVATAWTPGVTVATLVAQPAAARPGTPAQWPVSPAQRSIQLPMSERVIAFNAHSLPGTSVSTTGAKKRFVTDPPCGVPPRSRPA
jgi:hypothetical protein